MEKHIECENPRWDPNSCKSDKNGFKRMSKSGIVPQIAPQSGALFPTFFPKTNSATAAPSTIWVRESILLLFGI